VGVAGSNPVFRSEKIINKLVLILIESGIVSSPQGS